MRARLLPSAVSISTTACSKTLGRSSARCIKQLISCSDISRMMQVKLRLLAKRNCALPRAALGESEAWVSDAAAVADFAPSTPALLLAKGLTGFGPATLGAVPLV